MSKGHISEENQAELEEEMHGEARRARRVEELVESAKIPSRHWSPQHGAFCASLIPKRCLNVNHLACAEKYRREVA
jgi:hypothetical protein